MEYLPLDWLTVAAHLPGGPGDEPPRQTSAAGPANRATAAIAASGAAAG